LFIFVQLFQSFVNFVYFLFKVNFSKFSLIVYYVI